jgi:hypothetical protein
VAFSPRLRPVPETPAICEHLLKLGEDRPDDRGVIESIVAPEFLYGEPGPRLPSVDEQCNWYYDRLRKKDPPDLFARKATCSLGAADGQALMKCFHP